MTNTPVNATIIAMDVTDQPTLTVKSVLQMLMMIPEPVNVTTGGHTLAVNTGTDSVTQSVMAASDHLKMTVGTALTTPNVTARMEIIQDLTATLMEAVAAKSTGATQLTVAYTMEHVTLTVESTTEPVSDP